MVYCAATGSQYQVYMKLCLFVGMSARKKLGMSTCEARATTAAFAFGFAAFPAKTVTRSASVVFARNQKGTRGYGRHRTNRTRG
jgi:hypothetical protein